MSVINFPRHHRARCGAECEGCRCCEGGLFLCTRCGGAESSLTTECCGERMPIAVQDLVSAGRLDYARGDWIRDQQSRRTT